MRQRTNGLRCAGPTVACLVWVLVVPIDSAFAQVRTSDPMATHSLSIEGELNAGAAQERRAGWGASRVRPFAGLAIDVQDRVLRIGRDEEALFVELDANLRLGLREAYRDDGSWQGAWLSAWIAAAIAHRTPSLTLRASFGVAPPLRTALHRTLPEPQLTAGWGHWDHWLATADILPFGFMGLVEGRLGQIDLGADTALVLGPGLPVDTGLSTIDRGLYFWAGVGGWLAAHLGEHVRLGLRVQGMFWVHQGPETRCDMFGSCASLDGTYPDFQASVLPFVRVLFPPGYVELRLQINLDEPHGPTLAGADQVWALSLRGGASWDG